MTAQELFDEVMHMRRVLCDIEEYEIDWAVGTGENMARVQNMAVSALNRPIPDLAAPSPETGASTPLNGLPPYGMASIAAPAAESFPECSMCRGSATRRMLCLSCKGTGRAVPAAEPVTFTREEAIGLAEAFEDDSSMPAPTVPAAEPGKPATPACTCFHSADRHHPDGCRGLNPGGACGCLWPGNPRRATPEKRGR